MKFKENLFDNISIFGHSVGNAENNTVSNLFISEKEKYKNNNEGLKKIFNYYEYHISPQLALKKERYDINYDFRYGKINEEDFGLKIDDENPEPKIKIDNYPIAPNIVNTLIQEGQKRNYSFFPKTVDSQSTNEILEMMTEEIKNNLISKAKAIFLSKAQLPTDEELSNIPEEEKEKVLAEIENKKKQLEEEFKNIPSIQQYYKTKYKPEIVIWAEHLIERDTLKFNINKLSKLLLEDHIVVGDRILHVRDLGNDYMPEYIPSKNYGVITSPDSKCISESIALYWYEELEVPHIITKYGNFLSKENIEYLKDVHSKTYVNNKIRLHDTNLYGINKRYDEVNVNNYIVFNNMINGTSTNSYTSAIIRHCYFLVPRKLGKLTIRQKIKTLDENNNEIFEYKDIVEIIDPDVYETDKKILNFDTVYKSNKKTLENLIEGEHIDIFYINEVFYGCKINTELNMFSSLENKEDYKKEIWIKIEKLDYQGSSNYTDYGTQIPCFGGKIHSKTSTCVSELDKLKPYAVMHNYIMNRVKSLAISWIAPYYGINNSLFGQSSLEESWQEDPIFKSIIAGEETGVVPFDTTLNGTTNQLPQNIVRIDPDRSNMIRTFWEFATLIKQEAYSQIGTSAQFLGNISPNETATGVNMAQNRTLTQLEHIYEEHFELIKKIYQYMVDIAQVKHFKKGGLIDMSYVTSDAQREIFMINSDQLPLTKKIGLFMTNSSKENQTLELMRQLALTDNTMGASAYEKMLMIDASSKEKLLDKLRILREDNITQSQKRDEMIQNQQNSALEAQQQALLAKQTFEAEQNQLDRELELLKSQIIALGRSQNNDQNLNNKFDVVEIAKYNLENEKLYNSLEIERNKLDSDKENKRQKLILQQTDLINKQKISEQNYILKLKELDTKLKISNNQLLQAKENKNKYDKK